MNHLGYFVEYIVLFLVSNREIQSKSVTKQIIFEDNAIEEYGSMLEVLFFIESTCTFFPNL